MYKQIPNPEKIIYDLFGKTIENIIFYVDYEIMIMLWVNIYNPGLSC